MTLSLTRFVSALLSVSIALAGVLAPQPSAAQQQARDPLTMVQEVYRDAVIYLSVDYETPEGTGCESGTGFIISSSGYVLTSRHLITNKEGKVYDKYSIAGSVGEAYQCQKPRGIVRDLNLVRSEPEQDVMLLKIVADQVFNYVRACQQTKVDPGEKLYAIGFPLAQPLNGTVVTRGQTHGPMGRWNINGLMHEGSSGSPVLNASGRLVGLVFGGYETGKGYEFMVPLDHFKHLFGYASASLENCSTPAGSYLQSNCAPVQREKRVDWTLSEHRGLQTNSRQFRDTIPAGDGKVINSYEWRAMSANGASGVDINISPDRKSVNVTSQLTSGPIFDQWRGWVSGMLILSEVPEGC